MVSPRIGNIGQLYQEDGPKRRGHFGSAQDDFVLIFQAQTEAELLSGHHPAEAGAHLLACVLAVERKIPFLSPVKLKGSELYSDKGKGGQDLDDRRKNIIEHFEQRSL